MSLNFDVSKVKNHDEVTTAWRVGNDIYLTEEEIPPYDGEEPVRIWHPITEAIIFRTMSVGLGEITEENIEEFYARSRMFDRITQTMPLVIRGENSHITMQMLRDHIGLTANVIDETRKHWVGRILNYDMENFLREAQRENAKLKEGATA